MSVDEPRPTAPRDKRHGHAQITDRDLGLLEFVAEHRLVLAAHIQALLGISRAAAHKRLRALVGLGLLRHDTPFHRQPGYYQVTREGLGAASSRLPPPRKIDYPHYQHDVGVAWLWLAARRGAFGQLREIVSERHMRSHDGSRQRRGEPLGVRLGGRGPGGRPRIHYPDLLLVGADGSRIAVELELSSKGRSRRETILGGYGADPRIDVVLYLAGNPRVEHEIRASARRLGISPLVHVHAVRSSSRQRSASAAAAPARRRERAPVEATR
jgi:hypothetical protein